MKIWNWQKGLCDKTVEGHEDKIWSLREMPPNTAGEEQMDTDKPRARFVTGSADGKFAIWEDKSEELKLQRHREQVKKVTDHQTLANLLQKDNYVEALLLALDLNQPFQLIFKFI
jgi:U3 small nucleolar RNA-associated protein 13